MAKSAMRVILASGSPRRRQLLSQIFDSFDVLPQSVEEKCNLTRGHAVCQYLAKIKLGNLPSICPDALIISADTIVYKSGKIYGKPKDRQEAKEFLDELSAKWHTVYTGVAIYYGGKAYTFYDKSKVKFKSLDEECKLSYIDSGSPMDKAGGYGIQDEEVVETYEGSYTNIVGLPMEKLKEQLSKIIKE
ncbi:MAG: Maf family protein [Clostridia bacterium]|nr:Maf family protein [Clostridia bacterium]